MVHWFDRLSKTVARASLIREGPHSPAPEPFALVDSGDEFSLQAGPCLTTLRENVLTRRYGTQISRANGSLLLLERQSTRNLATRRSSFHLAIRAERTPIFDLRIDSAPGVATALSLTGVNEAGRAVQLNGDLDDGGWRWWLDGREMPGLEDQLAQAATNTGDLDVFGGLPIAEMGIEPTLLADIRELSYQAVRDAPTCEIAPPAMSTLSWEHFPGCIECVDKCDDHWPECAAAASAKAAACWLGYFVCLAYHMSKCMGKEADCETACHAAGGACCPVHCERGGYAECCKSGAICCGAICCPDGTVCVDPSNDLCCEPTAGEACGSHCCERGFKCASESRGFCCPEDAGEFCTFVWDEEHWTPRCCPPGQVCADGSIGLCCDAGHGPICGDECCKRHEVCQNGICCDPRMLCGRGEQAVCCDGECRDGHCCSKPSHMCGDTCCPPFNPCCEIDGRRVCCGAYEECMEGGCCPAELVCGKTCCQRGSMCADPKRGKCVPCEGDTVACQTADYDTGRRYSICCHPSVDCCNGKCCEPGLMCCAPGGEEPACYPSHYCVH